MELKLLDYILNTVNFNGSNRTFMELKFDNRVPKKQET